jgi:hypothetical protein
VKEEDHLIPMLKVSVSELDLSAIEKDFLQAIDKEWGGFVWEAEHSDSSEDGAAASPLETITNHWGDDLSFASLVAKEYRRFLVVKCVETKMAPSPPPAGATSEAQQAHQRLWSVKAHPSKLVDIFWHCHMLRPVKYWADCQLLISDLIDHDPSLVLVGLNTLPAKLDRIFGKKSSEEEWEDNGFQGRLDCTVDDMLFHAGGSFDVQGLAAMIWSDMQGYNDCG